MWHHLVPFTLVLRSQSLGNWYQLHSFCCRARLPSLTQGSHVLFLPLILDSFVMALVWFVPSFPPPLPLPPFLPFFLLLSFSPLKQARAARRWAGLAWSWSLTCWAASSPGPLPAQLIWSLSHCFEASCLPHMVLCALTHMENHSPSRCCPWGPCPLSRLLSRELHSRAVPRMAVCVSLFSPCFLRSSSGVADLDGGQPAARGPEEEEGLLSPGFSPR